MFVGGAWLEEQRGHLFALPFALPLACIVVLGTASGSGGRVIRFLSAPVANFLGRISYSLYMVHGMVFVFARSASIEFGWTHRAGVIWVLACTSACTAFFLAIALYRYVEVPCRRFMVAHWQETVASRVVRATGTPGSIKDPT